MDETRTTDMSLDPTSLLAPDEPPPATLINSEGCSGLVLVCDHASNRVPNALGDMGLSDDHFERHISYDIGAEAITRNLSAALDAPAVLAGYSRLVVDLNRPPGHPDGMPAVSDDTTVPGNQGLTPEDVAARLDTLFDPYHNLVRQAMSARWTEDRAPALFSVHSFTPRMAGGSKRPWDVGVLWNRDPRIARPLIAALHDEGLDVGDNLPYSGRDLAYTLNVHGAASGLANCVIEINQDQVADPEGVQRWSDMLIRALKSLIEDEALFKVEMY